MTDLDRIDVAILDALQNDARISNKELAARVGLAPSSCLQRVRSLRARGVVRGFRADVDPAALGIGLQALLAIRLARHSKVQLDTLYAYLLDQREVLTVMNVTGPNDLLALVAVADVGHLRTLIVERLATRDEVDHIETSVIYDLRSNPAPLPNYLPAP